MKIIIKTVKAVIGELEVTPEQTVLELKQQIAENQGTTPETVSLIYKSKMLKDDTQTLEQLKIQDGDNIVIVMKKAAQTAKPAAKPVQQAPVAQPTQPAPQTQAAPAPVQQSTQPAQEAVNIFEQPKPVEQPATFEPSQENVDMLVGMGFTAENARKALRKANNKIDVAANFLLEGIDLDSIPDPAQRAGRAPGNDQAGMMMGLGTKEEFIQEVQANPQQFEMFFQQIDNINPQVGQLARGNPGMLYDILLQSMQQQQGMVPQQAPQQHYQPPPQAAPQQPQQPAGNLQLTQQDEEAINRLTQLGFSRQQAVQAYIACDKNENYAANLLLDGMI